MGIYSGTNSEHQGLVATNLLREIAREEANREAAAVGPLCFAFGRLRLVNSVVAYRHGGPCLTDDGAVYLDLMLPYAVEIAHLDRSKGYKGAMRRLTYWLPKIIGETGEAGIASQWDALCETRSLALAMRRSESTVGNVQWLPTANKIRDDLRLRHAEREAINALYPDRPPIRTVGVIDPPSDAEKRERDRLRKEAARRIAGVRPQSSRTKTAQREALAQEIGCSARQLANVERAGTIVEFLNARGHDFQKVSAQYSYLKELGQILEMRVADPDATADALAVFRDILADPFAETWDEGILV